MWKVGNADRIISLGVQGFLRQDFNGANHERKKTTSLKTFASKSWVLKHSVHQNAKAKRQVIEWENSFAIEAANKRLPPRLYKELLQNS
jgi:hypothetical protein